MPVSQKMEKMIAGSSFIRRMFEQGVQLKARFGADQVFDFSLGNPNLEPPARFQEALSDLVTHPRPGRHGYMPNAGYPETRAAVAAYLSEEQGVEMPPTSIIMTVGAGGALNAVMKAVLDPRDEVITPTPCFPEYDTYADNHGGVCRHVPTLPDFGLDVDAIEAAIGPRTRVVLVNSPNNPTGRVYSQQSLEALSALLARKSEETGRIIYLLSDEPYRKIVYGDVVVPSIPALYRNTILVTSYSKDLSLAGERIGYVAASPAIPQVEKLMAALTQANRCLGYVNAPALMQLAVARCQGEGVDVAFYQRNRDLLHDTLVKAGFEVPRPDGAFYLFPRSPIPDDVAFAAEMAEKLVLVVPGNGFGAPGYFRLAYCVSHQTVQGALPVLREVGRKYFG